MRYVGTLKNDVVVAKGINYTDYEDKREIELTEEQYNSITLPCKLVDGEFIPCDYPEDETPVETTPEPEEKITLQLTKEQYDKLMSLLAQN